MLLLAFDFVEAEAFFRLHAVLLGCDAMVRGHADAVYADFEWIFNTKPVQQHSGRKDSRQNKACAQPAKRKYQ